MLALPVILPKIKCSEIIEVDVKDEKVTEKYVITIQLLLNSSQ